MFGNKNVLLSAVAAYPLPLRNNLDSQANIIQFDLSFTCFDS